MITRKLARKSMLSILLWDGNVTFLHSELTALVRFLISVRNHARHGSLSAVTLQVAAEAAFTLELRILRFLSRKA